jgi:hypothetical protein
MFTGIFPLPSAALAVPETEINNTVINTAMMLLKLNDVFFMFTFFKLFNN